MELSEQQSLFSHRGRAVTTKKRDVVREMKRGPYLVDMGGSSRVKLVENHCRLRHLGR